MSKLQETSKKIEEAAIGGCKKVEKGAVSAYRRIEDGVVSGYQKIENGAVADYKKVEGGIIGALFAEAGESIEEARARLAKGAEADGREKA